MSLTTSYNNLASTPTSISTTTQTAKTDNFHRAKLEDAIDGYNCICGDNVTIVTSNDNCSEVVLTKPKEQFKLITKIEARMSGKKKFVESGDTLIMTRTW